MGSGVSSPSGASSLSSPSGASGASSTARSSAGSSAATGASSNGVQLKNINSTRSQQFITITDGKQYTVSDKYYTGSITQDKYLKKTYKLISTTNPSDEIILSHRKEDAEEELYRLVHGTKGGRRKRKSNHKQKRNRKTKKRSNRKQ